MQRGIYTQERVRAPDWRDKEIIQARMVLFLDSGSVHKSNAARTAVHRSQKILQDNKHRPSTLPVLKRPNEREKCFVSNFYAQSHVHELVDRAPTCCSHTAAPASST
jgi:hypothetical protein